MSLMDRLVVGFLPLVPKFVVGKVASRYVAGETLADAVAVIERLNAEGAMATVDLLGEEVEDRAEAGQAVEAYLQALDVIHQKNLRCNVSVKPTQLGLELDEELCFENYDRVVSKARELDSFVRLDMEDRHTTNATLRIYRRLHERHRHCGVVFQSYMRRTLRDIAELPSEDANVRLCKGIYIEPKEAAWKLYETVRLNFLTALEKLIEQGVYVGIATHDEYLIAGAVGLIHKHQLTSEQYEFQMLLGVEDRLRRILIAEGHPLRVYVPFGKDWYLYSTRRLRENPAVAGHVMRAFLRRE